MADPRGSSPGGELLHATREYREHKTTMGTWDVCDCPGECDAKANRIVRVEVCGACNGSGRPAHTYQQTQRR